MREMQRQEGEGEQSRWTSRFFRPFSLNAVLGLTLGPSSLIFFLPPAWSHRASFFSVPLSAMELGQLANGAYSEASLANTRRSDAFEVPIDLATAIRREGVAQ